MAHIRIISAAALLAAACMGTGASAEPAVLVPAPYLIPLPPVAIEPSFEIGARYWHSVGKSSFNIDSSKLNPFLGNPTSTLTYDGTEGNSAEFTFRGKNASNIFAKGFVGGGWLSGGSLDDEDFFVGQVKFSDTYSRIDGDGLAYGTIDLGREFILADRAARVSLGPFIGFNYWQEEYDAFGARCNRDDLNACAPGTVIVPFSTKAITDEEHWASMRIGTELKVTLWDRLTLIGDAAILPLAYVWNNDSHHLRPDLGTVPNIEDRGNGWGYQLEAEARYDFGPRWSAGAGFRYWFAEADGKSEFVNIHINSKLDDFQSERYGVFADVAYRF